MNDQQYCLRWNNHQPNFISVFKSLLELEELVDVTLSVEGKHIKAHKVILSACSPYFKLLFMMTPCKHPIVILNDIKYTNLKTIVDFMYCGEINTSDEHLADILEIAEILQIRGLCDPNKTKDCSPTEKSCETSRKKRKRKSEVVGLNSVSKSDISTQGENEEFTTTVDSGPDTSLDPTECFSVNYDNVNTEYDTGLEPRTLLQEDWSPILSIEENKNDITLSDQKIMPNTSPHITRPVPSSMPVRRRSSKVQESENFLLALEAVRSGSIGFCKAAKLYGLNNRTLWLEYKKRGYPTTRPPVGLKNKPNTLSANPS